VHHAQDFIEIKPARALEFDAIVQQDTHQE
jgi:hypothetical protein